MTQEQNQPPAASTASREGAISRNPDQPTAHPTLRDRLRYGRLLRLTAADWHALIWLVVLTAGGNVLLIEQISHAPINLYLSSTALALGNLLAGALLAYTLLRRLLEDQIATSSEALRTSTALLERYDQTATESRHLLATAKRALSDAFDAGQQEALAQATQTYEQQIAALEAEIERYRQAPNRTRLAAIGEQATYLRRTVEQIKIEHLAQDQHLSDLERTLATVRQQATAIEQEIAGLRQTAAAQLDATDRLILELLTADPGTTDDELSRHPQINSDRTAVTRRRNKLAGLGYAVAQKRRGRRPTSLH